MHTKTMTAATALAVALGVTACGSSKSDTAASTAATPAPAASAPAAPAAPAAGGSALTVVGTEYAFAPTSAAVKAGKVKITLDNKGKIPHEFILLKTTQGAAALKINSSTSRVSETASVGEVSEIAAGKSASKTLDLKPGKYVYVCNIPAHYKLGMRGVLTVQ